ncbi:hypothetical protein [Rhodohalobacter sp.]|nr:hypothetical protein [Rhodohalobacter sp.]MDZ7755215.1 hypothetical protein [Rhodohalobacter sp.]
MKSEDKKKEIIILGAGGHGQVIASILLLNDKNIGFYRPYP